MKKYCTKCGHEFEAVGREVICPSCKAQAAEDAKRAAVMRAKRASWTGESVPVRISGRASTVIRRYGAANNLPFTAALDALLQASAFFQSTGKAWEEVEPYRSHRRDKHATETTSKPQEAPQEAPQEVKAAAVKTARVANKTSTANTTSTTAKKAASKTTSKAAGKAARKGGKE